MSLWQLPYMRILSILVKAAFNNHYEMKDYFVRKNKYVLSITLEIYLLFL